MTFVSNLIGYYTGRTFCYKWRRVPPGVLTTRFPSRKLEINNYQRIIYINVYTGYWATVTWGRLCCTRPKVINTHQMATRKLSWVYYFLWEIQTYIILLYYTTISRYSTNLARREIKERLTTHTEIPAAVIAVVFQFTHSEHGYILTENPAARLAALLGSPVS